MAGRGGSHLVREIGCGTVPRRGTPDRDLDWLAKGGWVTFDCSKCGSPVFFKSRRVSRITAEKVICKKCKTHGKKLGVDAALAVALRKKKMGIKW